MSRENDRSRRPRDAARAAGQLTFTTPYKCKRGHEGVRYVSSGECVQCQTQRRYHTFNGKPIPPRPPMNTPCPICSKPVGGYRRGSRGERKWVRDHDHDTGEFRGWICNNCNGGMGLLGDDPKVLRKAAHYLTKKEPQS